MVTLRGGELGAKGEVTPHLTFIRQLEDRPTVLATPS